MGTRFEMRVSKMEPYSLGNHGHFRTTAEEGHIVGKISELRS